MSEKIPVCLKKPDKVLFIYDTENLKLDVTVKGSEFENMILYIHKDQIDKLTPVLRKPKMRVCK